MADEYDEWARRTTDHAAWDAYAAHSRDLPVSPVGLTANPAIAHADQSSDTAAGPRQLTRV